MTKKRLTPIMQFRQLKQTIRKDPTNVILVGIDVSKRDSVACIADAQHNIFVKKLKFSNSRTGLELLMGQINKFQALNPKATPIVAMEPTGNYHKPLAHFFLQHQINVVGISTVAAKENRKSLDGRWKKNDPKDAFNIVDMLSQRKMFFYKEDPYSDSLKTLLKTRAQISVKLSSTKIRIRNNYLALYFPEIDSLYNNSLHHELIAIMQKYPTANDIAQCSFEEFRKTIPYRLSSIKAANRIKLIWTLAQQSIACPKPTGLELNIQHMIDEAKMLQCQMLKLNRTIKSFCENSQDYQLLNSIPGFGPWSIAVFMAFVGPIHNYDHPRQLAKLVGLDLEYIQSGKFRSSSEISKKGNALLRYALCTAAARSMRNYSISNYCQRFFLTKEESPVTKAKLRVKLADKLLRAAFAILKTRKPFDSSIFVNPALN